MTIGAGAMLGAQSGVMSDMPAGARWVGYSGAAGARLHEGAWPTLRRLGRAPAAKREGDGRMSGETLDAADIRDILRLLPHRYPFLMVDRVIDMRGDDHAHRHQERDRQRAAFPRSFSGQSGDARRADDRGHGADRGRACACA